MNCAICGTETKTVHHIVSRGAYGRDFNGYDVEGNLMPLCIKHHNEVHCIGRETFFNKYGMVDRLEIAKQLKYDYDIKKAGRVK